MNVDRDLDDERSFAELNALVDGELDPPRLAAAAARIAADPVAAGTFAALAAAKAGTVGALRSASVGRDRGRGAARVGSGLASVVLLLALGALVGSGSTLLVTGEPQPTAQSSVDLAARHVGQIPDLEPAGLRLERISLGADTGPVHVEAAYVGERGCRLRLTVLRGPERGGEPRESHRVARWTAGSLRFVLSGAQMDAERFASIAAFAQAQSRGEAAHQIVAVSSRLASPPCVG